MLEKTATEEALDELALLDPAADSQSGTSVAQGKASAKRSDRGRHVFACEAPPSRKYMVVKTCVEWVIAAILLALTSPLLLFLAGLVKLTSPGPAFYSQTRLGLGGRPYRIHKLRTMTHNCEAKTGPVWATPNDSRITPIGKILRDTHLDELPQLWNVLRGEMSLIGPRPERPEIVRRLDAAIPNYRARVLVRPGVTGLAQMRLPADSDLDAVHRKVAHDLYYVRELGPMLDLRIALSTVFYFAAAAANGVCRSLVGSYGKTVDEALAAEEATEESAGQEAA